MSGFKKFISIILCIPILFLAWVCLWAIYLDVRLPIHRQQWQLMRPPAYYMEVVEYHSGSTWRWQAYIQGTEPITVTLLEEENSNRCNAPLNEKCLSVLEVEDFTVEQMFERAQWCHDWDYEDCRMSFSILFGYPKRFGHLLTITTEIDKFVPCKQVFEDCP